jgi:hypothetical protein
VTEEENREQPVTALVLLRPGSGREITGSSPITAETLQDYLPDPDEAADVARRLRDTGFEVGPVGGISMAVTGPAALFEEFFGTKVAPAPDGGWVFVDSGGATSREVPMSSVPPEVATRVHAVTFEPPAELAGP